MSSDYQSSPQTTVRNLYPNDILFREGDPSNHMYLIQSGQISIRRMRGINMIEIARLHEGEILGELAFFDRTVRSATAVAITEVTILEIPYEGLDRVYDKVPPYLKAIIAGVVIRLRKANDVIRQLKNEEQHGNEVPLSSPAGDDDPTGTSSGGNPFI